MYYLDDAGKRVYTLEVRTRTSYCTTLLRVSTISNSYVHNC